MARQPRVLMSPEEGMHVFHPGRPRGGDPGSGMAIVALDQVEGQPTSQSKEDCTTINATRALAALAGKGAAIERLPRVHSGYARE